MDGRRYNNTVLLTMDLGQDIRRDFHHIEFITGGLDSVSLRVCVFVWVCVSDWLAASGQSLLTHGPHLPLARHEAI